MADISRKGIRMPLHKAWAFRICHCYRSLETSTVAAATVQSSIRSEVISTHGAGNTRLLGLALLSAKQAEPKLQQLMIVTRLAVTAVICSLGRLEGKRGMGGPGLTEYRRAPRGPHISYARF